MLKHEDIPQAAPQSPSAAQVRVTPEELVAAVTALQIRKEGQPGTISIGDAVEELGLDVTSEEVLAEVQARRRVKPKKPRSGIWDRAVLALGLGGIALWGSFFLMPTYPFEDASTLPTNMATIAGVPAESGTPIHITAAPNLTVGDASGKMLMLSEIGDSQPVHCRWYSGSLYPYSLGTTGEDYTLIKHNGRVYVRGWIKRMSPKVLALHGADISPGQSLSYAVRVTLPLKGFKEAVATSDTEMYGSTIPAVDIHLDKYAYEKW